LCLVPTAVIVIVLKSLALASVMATMIPYHQASQMILVTMVMTTMAALVKAALVKAALAKAALAKEPSAKALLAKALLAKASLAVELGARELVARATDNAEIDAVNYLKTRMKTLVAISDPDVLTVSTAAVFARRWSLVKEWHHYLPNLKPAGNLGFWDPFGRMEMHHLLFQPRVMPDPCWLSQDN
jgi:hypothetical protein